MHEVSQPHFSCRRRHGDMQLSGDLRSRRLAAPGSMSRIGAGVWEESATLRLPGVHGCDLQIASDSAVMQSLLVTT